MIDEFGDVYDMEYADWCPLCGSPRIVCDAYGDCTRAMIEADSCGRDVYENYGDEREGVQADE